MSSVGKLCLKLLIAIILSAIPCSCNVQSPAINPSILTPSKSIGECQACRLFVESFRKGLERTSRGKYEGGDAAWEEEKLKKSYKRSEMRLIDIQEHLCAEVPKHDNQCHHIAEKAEDYIEKWWSQDPDQSANLFEFICIDNLELCCPKHHYGKDCLPCKGNHDHLCSGNGKCRGDGTRKGSGTCLCYPGYAGEDCESCATGHYLAYKDEKKILCSPCHKSCLDDCRHSSPKDCVACKPGYIFDSEDGCTDDDECEDMNRCKKTEFCVNEEGSYKCFPCDESCDGCYGDGPDLCRKCSKDYSKKGELCIKDREDEDQTDTLTMSRYMTYVGLLITTAILLPKSTHLGSFVGIMVLSYIIGAEYYCMINGHTGLVNLKDFDLIQLFKI